MARILVTEEIADGGLDRLRQAGHQVDIQLGLSPEQLLSAIKGAHALIVRSATDVNAEVLTVGTDLIVVGRAGVGLDNVDVDTATARGVMVCNAPESNIASAAEQTMALLLSIARNVPQAHAALVQGRWERSKWEGVELLDKTLGIVGLGRIGKLVAQRAAAFGMRIVAFDPYISADRARQMNVELLPLDQLVAESDFLTVHLPKTKETVGLIGREMFLKAKPDLRVINVARGGIVDEAALYDALKGFFGSLTGEQVTYVNGPQIAATAGCEVRENNSSTSTNADYVNLVTLRTDGHSIAATLVGPRREARLVLVDDHITDVPPANNMLVVSNDDRPGVIGVVGTLLGNHNVNIADMDVGKALKPGTALMVIAPTAEVPTEVVEQLRVAPGILNVAVLHA